MTSHSPAPATPGASPKPGPDQKPPRYRKPPRTHMTVARGLAVLIAGIALIVGVGGPLILKTLTADWLIATYRSRDVAAEVVADAARDDLTIASQNNLPPGKALPPDTITHLSAMMVVMQRGGVIESADLYNAQGRLLVSLPLPPPPPLSPPQPPPAPPGFKPGGPPPGTADMLTAMADDWPGITSVLASAGTDSTSSAGDDSRQRPVLITRDDDSSRLDTVIRIVSADGSKTVGAVVIHRLLTASLQSMAALTSRWLLALGVVMITIAVIIFAFGRYFDRLLQAQQQRLDAEIGERQLVEQDLHSTKSDREEVIAERTQSLRDNQERLRSFLRTTSDWVWEADADNLLTYVSDGIEQVTGKPGDSFLGQRWETVIEPGSEETTAIARHRETMISRQTFRNLACSMPDGEGRRLHLLASGVPLYHDNGQFAGWRGSVTNITQLYEAEKTITTLGRILDQSANEIFVFEADTLAFILVNRGASRNLGYLETDWPSHTPLDILLAEERGPFVERLDVIRERSGADSEPLSFESRFRRRDGSTYPVDMTLQYFASEKPPSVIAIAQDITARKQAEQALEESEERYRSLAELSLDGIVVHADGLIVYANAQAMRIAEVKRLEDLIGRPAGNFVHPEDLATVCKAITVTRTSGTPTPRLEARLLRENGQAFAAELSASQIIYGGRPTIQTVLRDISEMKAVQGNLVQAAKLATLGEMAAGMAHELSQPMNVIRMAAEAVLMDKVTPDTDSLRSTFDLIATQAMRMGEIINHMRIFSRKQTDDALFFDPNYCIKEAMVMVEGQFMADNISIVARYPSGRMAMKGRPVQLEQVLINLFTNARDAIRARLAKGDDRRGMITIEASVEPNTLDTPAVQAVRIAVSDNGGGIPPDALERLFEPFYTTKEVGTGTGLGLSVSFGLVGAMGGTITASNVRDGARFDILLPLADGSQATPAPDRRVVLGTPPAVPPDDDDDDEPSALLTHILVVDDEAFASQLLADHLSGLGYRVSTAGDGEEGYVSFLEDPADLLITDLRMPRCDGMTLIQRLHDHVPDLPVIVVTGHLGHWESATDAVQASVAAVLRKPISLAEVSDLVKTLIAVPVPSIDL